MPDVNTTDLTSQEVSVANKIFNYASKFLHYRDPNCTYDFNALDQDLKETETYVPFFHAWTQEDTKQIKVEMLPEVLKTFIIGALNKAHVGTTIMNAIMDGIGPTVQEQNEPIVLAKYESEKTELSVTFQPQPFIDPKFRVVVVYLSYYQFFSNSGSGSILDKISRGSSSKVKLSYGGYAIKAQTPTIDHLALTAPKFDFKAATGYKYSKDGGFYLPR